MSYDTINRSVNDTELRDRVRSAIAKEAWANPDYGATSDGQLVQQAGPDSILGQLIWPCCIDFEADYAYAVDSGHEHPGGADVIPDAEVQSAVQVHWPTPPAPPAPVPPTITSISPGTAVAGQAGTVTLHVFGAGYGADTVVALGGTVVPTTVVGEGEALAELDAASATPGMLPVVVSAGGVDSAPAATSFTWTAGG